DEQPLLLAPGDTLLSSATSRGTRRTLSHSASLTSLFNGRPSEQGMSSPVCITSKSPALLAGSPLHNGHDLQKLAPRLDSTSQHHQQGHDPLLATSRGSFHELFANT
ncbi:unnamed protein product, partial [Amoebophrya sp. A25]